MKYFFLTVVYMAFLIVNIIGGHSITDKTMQILGSSIYSILLGLFLSILFAVSLWGTFLLISFEVLP